MLKRSNSFASLPNAPVGIEAIGERLKVINPFAGVNPSGLCLASSIETAEVLTNYGRKPKRVNFDSPDDAASKAPHEHDRSFGYNNGCRSTEVWAWLKSGAVPRGAVFVVEMDAVFDGNDQVHSWNFVKSFDLVPSLHLIDSSTHIFKEVVNRDDFSEWMTEDFAEPMELFNYASPEGMVDDDLEVYYWGQLVSPWADMLRRPAPDKSREAFV